ncbi:MAG: hypothetical protein WC529_06030 [Candidatus Margulisiibacteriota bacterium]
MSNKIALFRAGQPVNIYQAAFAGRHRDSGLHGPINKTGIVPFASRSDRFADLPALNILEFGRLSGALIGPKSGGAAEALSSPTDIYRRFAQITDGILARVNRVVREELTEPDLNIVVDDALFLRIQKLAIGGDPLGMFKGHAGFFLNRAVIEQTTQRRERALYKKVFSVMDDKLGFRADRLVLLPGRTALCAPWTVVHEVIHDVIDVSARKYPKEFARLVDRIFALLKDEKRFAVEARGGARRALSFGSIFFDATHISYWCLDDKNNEEKAAAVKELAAKFFSGQLIDQSSGNGDKILYRLAYYYLQTNMPQDIRDMFFALGLRWPPAIDLPQ